MSAKKVAFLGVMTTLSLILSYVESLIPVFVGIPGVKLGLANLVIVFILYRMSVKDALLISVMRILLSGFMFGNLMSILFSLAGTFFSICIMYLMKKMEGFSILGVSIAGACMHNLGQLCVAAFVVQTARLIYYFPILLISGVITGLLIGILVRLMLQYIPDFYK